MIIHKIHAEDHEEIIQKSGLLIALEQATASDPVLLACATHGDDRSYILVQGEAMEQRAIYCIFGGTKEERKGAYQEILKSFQEDFGGEVCSVDQVRNKNNFSQN